MFFLCFVFLEVRIGGVRIVVHSLFLILDFVNCNSWRLGYVFGFFLIERPENKGKVWFVYNLFLFHFLVIFLLDLISYV